MEATQTYKFSNTTIKTIVQLIQLGILTGTDVSDQMRMIEVFVNDDNNVEPTPEFLETFESNLAKLEEMANDEQRG